MVKQHKKGSNGQSMEAAPVTAKRITTNPRIEFTGNVDEDAAQLRAVWNLAVLAEWFASVEAVATSHSKANAADGQRVNQPIQRSA